MFNHTSPTILVIVGDCIIIIVTMKFKIKSKKFKDKFIHGDFLENKSATELVIFLGGFSGGARSPLFKNTSVIFAKNGFSVVGFNFCNDCDSKHCKVNNLRPEDMSFSVYLEELKNIVDSFGKKYSKIVFVGHSFGAIILILFLSKYKKYTKNTELVLWDPSLLPWKREWMEMDFVFDIKKKLYFGKNGKEVMNKEFYKECISIKNTADTLQALKKKVCIVAAKNGAHKEARKYFLKIHRKKYSMFFVIKGAGHMFAEKHAQKELLNKTISFLKTGISNQ